MMLELPLKRYLKSVSMPAKVVLNQAVSMDAKPLFLCVQNMVPMLAKSHPSLESVVGQVVSGCVGFDSVLLLTKKIDQNFFALLN